MAMMLEEKDLQAISEMLNKQKQEILEETMHSMKVQKQELLEETMHNVKVLIENEVAPKFSLLAEGQQTILETLAPKSKVDDLEEEVKFLKVVVRQLGEDLQKLKKAN